MDEDELKVPLLLFSGGLDSTYILKDLLQKSPVDIVYIDSPNIYGDKTKPEDQARQKIIDYLNMASPYKVRTITRYEHLGIKCSTISWSPSNINEVLSETAYQAHWLKALGGVQAMINLDALATAADSDRHSKAVIGYIAGDSVIPFLGELQAFWKARHFFASNFYSTQVVPLEFPLATSTKAQVMENMHEGLVAMTWTCELPNVVINGDQTEYVACGQCTPCKTKRNLLLARSADVMSNTLGKSIRLSGFTKEEVKGFEKMMHLVSKDYVVTQSKRDTAIDPPMPALLDSKIEDKK